MNSGKEPKHIDWSAFIYGSIAGMVPWILMYSAIFRIPAEFVDEIPWYVWFFLIEYFCLFFSFPANMILQYM